MCVQSVGNQTYEATHRAFLWRASNTCPDNSFFLKNYDWLCPLSAQPHNVEWMGQEIAAISLASFNLTKRLRNYGSSPPHRVTCNTVAPIGEKNSIRPSRNELWIEQVPRSIGLRKRCSQKLVVVVLSHLSTNGALGTQKLSQNHTRSLSRERKCWISQANFTHGRVH